MNMKIAIYEMIVQSTKLKHTHSLIRKKFRRHYITTRAKTFMTTWKTVNEKAVKKWNEFEQWTWKYEKTVWQ